jgi:uncharacterized protein (AIM24 family)
MQTVEVELDPGETVIAEAGAMNWMEDGISFEAKTGGLFRAILWEDYLHEHGRNRR